jgi:hypothetical protein
MPTLPFMTVTSQVRGREFIESSDYLQSLALIEPDPVRQTTIRDAIKDALASDPRAVSTAAVDPRIQTRAYETRALGGWGTIRVFLHVDSAGVVHIWDAENA